MISAKVLRRHDGPGPTSMGDTREKSKAPVLPVSRETTKQHAITHNQQVQNVYKLLVSKGESAAKEIQSRIRDGRDVVAKGITFGPEILTEALQLWKAEQRLKDAATLKDAPTTSVRSEEKQSCRSEDNDAASVRKAGTGAVPQEYNYARMDVAQPQQVKRKLHRAFSDEGAEPHVDAQPKKMPRTTTPESLPRPKPMPHKSPSLRERLSVRGASLNGVDLLDGELPKSAPVRRALSPASTATPCRRGTPPTHTEAATSIHQSAPRASPPRSPTSEFAVWSSQDSGDQQSTNERKLPRAAPHAYSNASYTSAMPSKIVSPAQSPAPPQVLKPCSDRHRLQQPAAEFELRNSGAGESRSCNGQKEPDVEKHSDPSGPQQGQAPRSSAGGRSIKELKILLADAGVDIAGCVEKAELSALWQQLESIRAWPLAELQASCSAAGGPRFGTAEECANFLMSTTRQPSSQNSSVTAPRQPAPAQSTQSAAAAAAAAASTATLRRASFGSGPSGAAATPQLSSENFMETPHKVPPSSRTASATDSHRQAECSVRELDTSREAARILRLKRDSF